jgi:hypothetical protein
MLPAAYVIALTGAYQSLMDLSALANPTGPDWQMYVLHSPGISAEGPPSEVTSLTTQTLIATQRRRLR